MKNSITYCTILCIVIILFICPTMVFGQNDSTHVHFHGSNTLLDIMLKHNTRKMSILIEIQQVQQI
jgi:hypothetical protein